MKYKLLGRFTQESDWMKEELTKFRSMKGFFGKEKHLNVLSDPRVITKVVLHQLSSSSRLKSTLRIC